MFKIFHMEQGSHLWHEWRSNGIGASDIAVIMGSSPYHTPKQLWDIKCGYLQVESNFAMEHGKRWESTALAWVNASEQLNLMPTCIQSDEVPYFRASLDGYDPLANVICEIKCPLSKATIDGMRNRKIPDHWWLQAQWQLSLMGSVNPPRFIFAVWDHEIRACYCIEIYGHPELHKKMHNMAHSFWRHVVSGIPPELTDKDYVKTENSELAKLLEEYGQLNAQGIELEREKDAIKERIKRLADGQSLECNGFKVKLAPARVAYNMEAMRADGIDVDKYAKAGQPYYLIHCPKGG